MKAVLVTEMPKKCRECRYAYCDNYKTYQTEEWFCIAVGFDNGFNITCNVNSFEEKESQKSDNCPLKQLPSRLPKETPATDFSHPLTLYSQGYHDGWNDFMDELTGEENG